MAAFIFAIIIVLIALGAITVVVFGKYPRNPRVLMIVGSVVALVAAGFLFFFGALFHSVPTKSVGVITSYGKVVGTPFGPGVHLMAPWKSLNIIQDTIQSDNFAQSNGSAADTYTNSGAIGNCITVRLGGNQEGCADVQLQTQVDESAIPDLFANYSSYGADLTPDIDKYVVKRDLVTVLNHTLGDYNPVADVSVTLNSSGASQFSAFDPSLLFAMQSDLQGQVHILNINLQYVHYDQATQDRINQIATQYANTQVAKQQEATNAAISLANAALIKQNALSPAVLQNECYTTTQDAVKAGYALPAGWNCSGGSSSVLVQGK